jgi:hypothetical protein
MSTSPSNPKPVFLTPAGIQVTGPDVNIADLDPTLHSFLIVAGLVHLHLFDQRLCVARGLCSNPREIDAYTQGRAVDLLPPANHGRWERAFAAYLDVLADRLRLTSTYATTLGCIDRATIEVPRRSSH